MKTFINKKSLLILIPGLVVAVALFANDEEFRRNYNKEFEINKNTSLTLDNKYGSIDVYNWNENKISVDVVVMVRTSNKNKAEELLNDIDITITESENMILARTDINDDFDNFKNNDRSQLDIKYTIRMPSTVPLNLTNKYGNVFIDELKSTSTIDIKYGSLKANRILHGEEQPYTQIIIGYSNATIQNCSWTRFDIKYSNLEIETSKALIVVSKYSKIAVDKGTSVVTESKYDSYRIGKISNLVATSGYSNFKAEEISNKIQMETKYTDLHVNYVPSTFESIKVNISYGNYAILIDPSASYKLDGYAKYAKIYYPENSRVSRFNENNEMKVNGQIGSNTSAKSVVSVSSSYADVKLTE